MKTFTAIRPLSKDLVSELEVKPSTVKLQKGSLYQVGWFKYSRYGSYHRLYVL